jgi:hypothetical protein
MNPYFFADGRIVLNVIVLDITEQAKIKSYYYKQVKPQG